MKHGDFYTHFRGGEYFFDCLALPKEDRMGLKHIGTARHHENERFLDLWMRDGVTFVDADVPFVIYQAEKDYDTGFVWAREVDSFFGYKQKSASEFIKRFTLQN